MADYRWLLLRWLLLRWLLLGSLILDGCLRFLVFANSLSRNWMLRQPLLFTYWLPTHPVFWFTPFHTKLGYVWLPTPHCAAIVWLTGRYATPLIIKYLPPNSCLGKQRISIVVAIVLSRASAHIPSLIATSSINNFDSNLYVSRLENFYLW